MKNFVKEGGKFQRVKFPLELFNDFHAIQLLTKDEVHAGLGTDLDEKKAFVKAYVECLERKAFLEVGVSKGFISTNGIAGHRFKSLAKKFALAEVYERDSFLLHWYSKTPFLKIADIPSSLSEYVQAIDAEGYFVRFYETYLGVIRTSVCFLISKETGGFVVGLSSGKTKVKETEKAFSEAIVNLYFGASGKSKEELCEELKVTGLSSLRAHRTYWFYENSLPEWVLSSREATVKAMPFKVEVKSSFQMKIKSIWVVGIKLKNVFEISVGLNSKEIRDLLTLRIKRDINSGLEEILPHPIP